MKVVRALFPIVALLGSCGPSAYDRARREDTPEAYARFLREKPDDAQTPYVKRRLAELEFQQARRQSSILAYKRFLAEYPESDRCKDAAILLENLRFEAAATAGTSLAWNELLRDHPDGAHAAQARERLDEVDFRDAVAAGTCEAMADYLARHPGSSNRPQAEKISDDRLFAESLAGGPRGLMRYLEKSTAGAHRDEARARLAEVEATARAAAGDFEGARRAAERVLDEAGRARALAGIDALELDGRTASLDPKALSTFASTHEGPLALEAQARAGALTGGAALPLKKLALRLDPGRFARPEDELVRVLSSPDPRERWLAAEELGRMGARRSVDALLEAAATSRFSRVRERAFAALQGLLDPMPAVWKDIELRSRLEALRKVARSPELQGKVALLEDLLGEEAAAVADYARSMRGEPADLFVLRRIVALRGRRGEGFGVATAARELAARVHEVVEQRSQEEGQSAVLLARTLCGAREDARAALEALQRLPLSAARDFAEDRAAFTHSAEDALRFASARLSDAEARARAADGRFAGCEDDGGLRERLEEGERDRLDAVARLTALAAERGVDTALALAARRDPSPRVREAATAAVARGGAR